MDPRIEKRKQENRPRKQEEAANRAKELACEDSAPGTAPTVTFPVVFATVPKNSKTRWEYPMKLAWVQSSSQTPAAWLYGQEGTAPCHGRMGVGTQNP